jgi:lipopolysaccharide transport system ATP-binding protein
VSFDLTPGESLGIVGENGAGKTTLLRLITGTTQPTEGTLVRNGRVAAVLELGMGFHPEFSGRENALLTGTLLGFDAAQIREALPEAARFSELGAAFDRPLRTYSSGMIARLAFAAATAIRPDVLIIDEALSVGDAYFQQRSFQRLREFQAAGTALLFVSHDLVAVKTLCDRALYLHDGRVAIAGDPELVIAKYHADTTRRFAAEGMTDGALLDATPATRFGTFDCVIDDLQVLDADGHPIRAATSGTSIEVVIIGRRLEAERPVSVGILLRDRLGNDMFGTNTHLERCVVPPGEQFEVRFGFRVMLGSGQYTISPAIATPDDLASHVFDWRDRGGVIDVLASDPVTVGVCRIDVTTHASARATHAAARGPLDLPELATLGGFDLGGDSGQLLRGWFPLESPADNEPYRWTGGEATFLLRAAPGASVYVRGMTPQPNISDAPVTVALDLHGLELGRLSVNTPGPFEARWPIPESLTPGIYRARLTAAPTWAPQQVLQNADPRILGIAVHRLECR